MIQELTAIELIDSELLGGSTKPWLIRAENSLGEISDIVVKIFTEKQLKEGFSINKEIRTYPYYDIIVLHFLCLATISRGLPFGL